MTGKWGAIPGKLDLIRVSEEFALWGSTVNKIKGPNSGKHVYHLPVVVDANDKQNSALVNRIACTICTNQFHLPKNGSKCVKLVSKLALKK